MSKSCCSFLLFSGVANEKAFVRKQADMVKAQKGELLQKLQEIRFVKVPQAEDEQRQQNDHLDRIRRDVTCA